MCDLKTLADVGINIMINGVERNFRGAVLMCLGDNLGINALAGFKESFSFALRFCRTCYVTNSTFKSVSDPSSLELRSDIKHCVECELVESPLSNHYSKNYGINRRSALMDIPYFSMFNGGLPHDIMHDVFEGVKMLLLVRILPLLIGDVIPFNDPNWECFLILARIIDILICPWSSSDLCAILKLPINEHHRCFVRLYTEAAVIPKFHFLLHYPNQIMSVGPMNHTWNMRNEAKMCSSNHQDLENFAFSVANRHQRLLCYELSLLARPSECGPCKQDPKHIQEALRLVLPSINNGTHISRPSWVKILGTTIKRHAYVVNGSDGQYPKYIIFLYGVTVLQVSHYLTDYFDHHFHAYAIKQSQNQSYILFSDIQNVIPCIFI